jgi:predicted phosphoribosyltransferase/dienelactone hydrolase
MIFEDRLDAGRRLGTQLESLASERPVVLAIPRGGVPVASEVARALGAPLDVLAVRKLGAPGHPEYGIGAIAEGGIAVLDPAGATASGVTQAFLDDAIERESTELRRRMRAYRGERAPIALTGRTVIVVDDGLATGLSDVAAVRAVRRRGAARVVVAAPVASAHAVELLSREADDVACLSVPHDFESVGRWYQEFDEVGDGEVVALLAESVRDPLRTVSLSFRAGAGMLRGDLRIPQPASGLVIFAHGSGSSRLSPRNRAVAGKLNEAGLATLLADLLTEPEAADRERVFDIALLADRLKAMTRWAQAADEVGALPIGFFGASTGAAAALTAAADLGEAVGAVVSRGGRPDLAARLPMVTAPTLLVVGGADQDVLALNADAARRLRCPHDLVVVPGAGHLFEEPGALEAVSAAAADWFSRHLTAVPLARAGGS